MTEDAHLRIGELSRRPGVSDDLGLIAFGLALRERGWRIDSRVPTAAERLKA